MADDIVSRLRAGELLSPQDAAQAADYIEQLEAAGDALSDAFESVMRRNVLYGFDAVLLVQQWGYVRESYLGRG